MAEEGEKELTHWFKHLLGTLESMALGDLSRNFHLPALPAELQQLEPEFNTTLAGLRNMLQREQEKNKTFLNLGHLILLSVDESLKVSLINHRGAELFGLPEEELMEKNWLDLLDPTGSKPGTRAFLLTLQGENKITSASFETFIQTPNRGERTIVWNIAGSKNGHTGSGHLFFAGEDVTESRKLIEEATASEEKYRTLVETMDEGVMTVDNADIIRFVNKKYCEITGYPAEFLIGKNATELLLDNTYKSQLQKVISEREKGDSSQYEVPVRISSGDTKWLLISGCPLYDKKGEVVGSIGIHTDITLRKEIENELIAAKEIAEESSRVKETFFANMSHEIRTPMNGIVGLTNLLSKTALNAKQQEYLKAIQKSSSHLLVIIDDILDFSKIEAGKLELNIIRMDLFDLIDNAIKIMAFKAEEKGLILENHIDGKIPRYVMGDPVRINQILTNLLSNSVKFTESGKVRLAAMLKCRKGDDLVLQFEINDTGIGIPEAMQKKVFESFIQANSGIMGRYGGTGLGLSIVKGLVTRHEGEISLKSAENEGTTVTFTLNLVASSDDQTQLEAKAVKEEKPLRIKVLVAEDNPINQLLIKEVLKHWECVTEVVENGLGVVQRMEENDYDLVLMDIQMPEMNGLEATRYIRTRLNARKAQIPVIALTAQATQKEKQSCFEAGVNDYITKPFETLTLYNMIVKHLYETGKPQTSSLK